MEEKTLKAEVQGEFCVNFETESTNTGHPTNKSKKNEKKNVIVKGKRRIINENKSQSVKRKEELLVKNKR